MKTGKSILEGKQGTQIWTFWLEECTGIYGCGEAGVKHFVKSSELELMREVRG